MNDLHTMQVTRSLAMSSDLLGAMICIRGGEIGTMLPLKSDKRVRIGRDPGVCQFVIHDSKVSRVHLDITYIGALNQYLVVDLSSNGTFLENGIRLVKNREYYLAPKTELAIGTKRTVYKLR